MSLPRTTGAIASATTTMFSRLAAKPRPCPLCLRNFSSSTLYRQSSKRQMQTATAYQPSTLSPEIPPRNFRVPDTSITSNAPGADRSMPPQPEREQRQSNAKQTPPSFGVTEEEAQKSQPMPSSSPAKPLRPRRYKFGPRKATIKLSPSAVSHLKALLDQPEPKLIRIGTKAKGCSGLAYHLEYVDKPSPLDEQVEQDGVKVLIDNKALLNIIGSEMDWLEDKLNQRFVFKNPNISKSRISHLKRSVLTNMQLSSAAAESRSASRRNRPPFLLCSLLSIPGIAPASSWHAVSRSC